MCIRDRCGTKLAKSYSQTILTEYHTLGVRNCMHLASQMLLNGFIIHQNCNNEYRRCNDFIIKCCEELLTKYSKGCKEMFDENLHLKTPQEINVLLLKIKSNKVYTACVDYHNKKQKTPSKSIPYLCF